MSDMFIPNVTISLREVKKGKLIKNKIPIFPSLLDINGTKRIVDPISGLKKSIPKIFLFENEEWSYIVKKLLYADYILSVNRPTKENPKAKKIIVIKRMLMEELVKYWTKQGRKSFRELMKELRNNWKDVEIQLIIEGYYMAIQDYSDNCIWITWRFDKGKKSERESLDMKGKLKKPRYANSSQTRHNVSPMALENELKRLELNGIKVIKKTNREDVWNHFKTLIYDEDENFDENLMNLPFLLNNLFPFLNVNQCQNILLKYKSISEAISAISMFEFDLFEVENITKQKFQKMRSIIMLKEVIQD